MGQKSVLKIKPRGCIEADTVLHHLKDHQGCKNVYWRTDWSRQSFGGGCLFDLLYHEFVCCIYRPRTRFCKIHDFVPFGIWKDPVKLLLKFFFKIDIRNILCSWVLWNCLGAYGLFWNFLDYFWIFRFYLGTLLNTLESIVFHWNSLVSQGLQQLGSFENLSNFLELFGQPSAWEVRIRVRSINLWTEFWPFLTTQPTLVYNLSK